MGISLRDRNAQIETDTKSRHEEAEKINCDGGGE